VGMGSEPEAPDAELAAILDLGCRERDAERIQTRLVEAIRREIGSAAVELAALLPGWERVVLTVVAEAFRRTADALQRDRG
jgi:hypothetical protein